MRLMIRIVAVTLICSGCAFGQLLPDPSLWSGDPNPDGSLLVPVMGYEPDTGIVFLNTLGLNQVPDTSNRTTIGGDDVGVISFSVEQGWEAREFLIEGFEDGVVWSCQNFAKAVCFGVGAGANFLAPTGYLPIMRYDAGLDESNFGTVEIAVNYDSGIPGGTIFGRVQVVPEPSSIALLVFATIGFLPFLRTRQK